MRQEQSELAGLFMMLLGDLDICSEELGKSGALTFWDRAYAHALFALIEGVTYRMRQVLLAGAAEETFAISEPQLQKLREVRLNPGNNGASLEECPNFLSIRDGLKVTIRVWAGVPRSH